MPELPRGAPRMMAAPRPIVQRGGGGFGDVLEGAADLAGSIGGVLKAGKRAEFMEGLPDVLSGGDSDALLAGAVQAANLDAPGASRMLYGQYGDVMERQRAADARTARAQSNQMLARELFAGDEKALRTATALASYPDQFDKFVQDRVKPEDLGSLRQAWDDKTGKLVFATDRDIREGGLRPPGAKPGKPGKSVRLYNPDTGAAEVFTEGSGAYNSALAAGYDDKPVKVTYWSPGGKTVTAVLGKHDPAQYERAGYSRVPVAGEESFRTVTLYPVGQAGGDPISLERGSDEHRRLIGSREWVERSPRVDIFDQFLSAAMAGSLAQNGGGSARSGTGPVAPVSGGEAVDDQGWWGRTMPTWLGGDPAGGTPGESGGGASGGVPAPGSPPVPGGGVADPTMRANLDRAREALRGGGDPAAVAEKLRGAGIDPKQIPELRGY